MADTAYAPLHTRPIHWSSLPRHHRRLLLYGIAQAAAATLVTGLGWLPLRRVALGLPGQPPLFEHSPVFIVLTAVLLAAAAVYALVGATRAALWLRLLAALAVAGLLLDLGATLRVEGVVALPILAAVVYALWRGQPEDEARPFWSDVAVLGALVALVWVLCTFLSQRPPGLGPLGALYQGVAGLVTVASFLPVPLLLLSGLDLAELAQSLAQRLSAAVGGAAVGAAASSASAADPAEGRRALLALLVLSAAKIAFYVWHDRPLRPDSGWLAVLAFLLACAAVYRFAPAEALEVEPRFGHWLGMAAVALLVPLGLAVVVLAGGQHQLIPRIGSITLAAVGPLWLAAAAALTLRTAYRPTALLFGFAGLWVTLSVGLAPLSQLATGHVWRGLAARDLDLWTAVAFTAWSGWLLAHRRGSRLAVPALAVSIFLDCGFVLDRLLNAQVEVAELYAAVQAALFLAAAGFGGLTRRGPARAVPWAVAAALVAVAVLRPPLGASAEEVVIGAVLAMAILWDLLSSEHRMGGLHATRHAARPGRLMLYVAYATWVVAQLVFADTGSGDRVLALAPLFGLGYIIFGAPRVFLAFLAGGREPARAEASVGAHAATVAPPA